MTDKHDIKGKVVFIGNASVGKTSLVIRAETNLFEQDPLATLGASNTSMVVEVDNETVELALWDTAGQENYRSITPVYYRGATAGVIVFSVSDAASFEAVGYWYDSFKSMTDSDPTIVLVGNKVDVKERAVVRELAELRASEWNVTYLETSAASGEGVRELFNHIGKIVQTAAVFEPNNLPNDGDHKKSVDPAKKNDKSNCC